MKYILNPFVKLPGYDCFGCSPNNPIGLRMQFYVKDDLVFCDWNPSEHYQGWKNVLHGGIQATLMDEIASWVVFVKIGSAGVTKTITVEYIKPVYIKWPIRLIASLVKYENPIANIKVALYSNNELCSEADVSYFVYPEEIARRKFYYPGLAAFLNENDAYE